MVSTNISERTLRRIRILRLVMFCGFVLLASVLFHMQIGRGQHFQSNIEQQSIRDVRTLGARGTIFDRNGIRLAYDVPNYCIAIYLEELKIPRKRQNIVNDAWKLTQTISKIIGQQPEISRSRIETHLYNQKPLPLLAWQHIDQQTLARFAEAKVHLPAVDIVVESDRIYPLGSLACHLLGYVSVVEYRDDSESHYRYYCLPNMTGISGLEKVLDDWLTGEPGGQLVRVDVTGFKYDEVGFHESMPGGDLLLSIDSRIQRCAEQIISNKVGAVVVLDPRNGDVLALASSPGFDPNLFYPSISRNEWKKLVNDKRKPFLNRAISGLYPPGSIFKPVVAMVALNHDIINETTIFDCPGYFEIGNQRLTCFMHTVHGPLDIRKALEVSCNVFFFRLGIQCGYDRIYPMARDLGLGRNTGIESGAEASGLLPTREWKQKRYGEPWRAGDTCNIAIGQGALLVTPIQMAMMAAAIANGGQIFRPRLVLGRRGAGKEDFQIEPPLLLRDLHLPLQKLSVIKEGMRSSIQEPTGTGHLAAIPGIVMAGKTGTAEFGKKGGKRNQCWMILFAPYDEPRYAVAMLLEDERTGGFSVAPNLRQLMDLIFSLPKAGSS